MSSEELIAELNSRHFVVQEGGKTRIMTARYDRVLERKWLSCSTFEDFRNLYCNRYVEVPCLIKGKPSVKFEQLGVYWINSPHRRQYDEILFVPGGEQIIDNCYNLWQGFSIEEDEHGCWDLLKQHIKENVCDNNEIDFKYYLGWMANAVQHPDEQANTSIVLRGNRGVGKGTAIEYFCELFGQHYVHVRSSRQVTGNFNNHLRDAVVLYSNEAVYAGSKTEESALKGLITERYLPIEAKGRDLIMVKNNLHVLLSTNNDWAVPAGLDERRFFVLNVNDNKKQNVDYFAAIKEQMDNGGRGKMLHDLLTMDLSDFDKYTAPKTKALLDQKIESMSPEQSWWYSKLQQEYLFDGLKWKELVPSEAVYNDYIDYSAKIGHKFRMTPTQFGIFMHKVLPEGWPVYHRMNVDDYFYDAKLIASAKKQLKHYEFPEISVCRDIFKKILSQEVSWEKTEIRSPSLRCEKI